MSQINLTELQARIGQINEDHGFNQLKDVPTEYQAYYLTTKIMLMVTELAEASEEVRAGNDPTKNYFNDSAPTKPEGLPSELADTVIRAFSLAFELDFDLGGAIFEKLGYNATRPYRHGKAF